MIKNKLTLLAFLCLFLFPFTFSSNIISRIPTSQEMQSTFNPIVNAEEKMDVNGNKIHDHLEAILQSGFVSDVYTTIATFDRPITQEIIEKIKSIGGEVITTWSVIYGAAIRIQGTNLFSLSTIPEINFVTENYRCHALLSTSVPQINVRPYVWNTLGYEGSSGDAIAIIDTGIDDTHSDLSGGKLTYWEDFIGASASSSSDEYGTYTDKNGHGTHCASIAAGSGAAGGTATNVEISGTMALPEGTPALNGYVNHVDVETTGQVRIEVQWYERPGPDSLTDTIFIMMDTNNDGSFDGSDQGYVTGDHSAIPIVYTTSSSLSPGQYLFLIGPYQDGEIGRASIQYKIIRPASSTSDGDNKYRGVAPNCKIVGLKALDDSGVGTQATFTDALDWVYNNGLTYDVTVVSMSLGFDSKIIAVDQAVNNLVSEGYVCVAAAGNGFMDGDYVYSPGTATKAITVGAIDDVDKIAIYSSNGGGSDNKPDIVAPGGAYKAPLGANEETHPIIAADTNDADIVEFGSGSPETYWESEMNTNDYAGFQGTSMATPHVAGLAALMIQAMSTNWTHSEADVLEIKNLLCGTATEVSFGEQKDAYDNTPTLNKGYRDKIEGFGKVHGDAAIEAFLSVYIAGSNVTDSLSSSPSGKQCWARRVELKALIEFTAGIEISGLADYDLYLYDPSVDMTSANGFLAKSTTTGNGVPENIAYTPGADKTAYIVVKRVSGSGSFTLKAEATKTGVPTGFIGIPVALWALISILGLSSTIFLMKRHQ